jgi:hypothetical protein
MDYALMFDVLEGGVSQPIVWDKENLKSDKNIIILDEGSSSLYLWHGATQGLVARRTALRQAESLKGHGYTVGKSIVGRDIKMLKEIDQRKIGRDPETDRYNEELQALLNRDYKELDNFIISYSAKGLEEAEPVKTIVKSEPKTVAKPEPRPMPKEEAKPISAIQSKLSQEMKSEIPIASEYETKTRATSIHKTEPIIKSEPMMEEKPSPTAPPILSSSKTLGLSVQAKIGFVLMAILDHYDDIWISKKENGAYAVEHMDGKVCEFTISEGKIRFTADSFAGIATNIKTEIQKKFVDLSKLI